ncbi:hypothetical protein LMG7974_00241 [Campylobacter majalis]|uniref:Uncharacterized protein n=1 Tax=Campylobacter majalis TaxID=2790656 RepID=A0ABN7K462_9BACT|nr:AAA family ATPase [Campylobacter majalis]CAD7287328.1 hypothetical protein LMG7974_00241 [Campylobacter majalis]
MSKRRTETAYIKYLNQSIQKAQEVGGRNYWDYNYHRKTREAVRTINTEFDASDKYIVDNIIARKSITLIVASSKKGKTALGPNLGTCINEGIDFLENKVNKVKVVYYCNELSGRLIQERIRGLELPYSSTMKFYEGTSYVDFDEFEKIIK